MFFIYEIKESVEKVAPKVRIFVKNNLCRKF